MDVEERNFGADGEVSDEDDDAGDDDDDGDDGADEGEAPDQKVGAALGE